MPKARHIRISISVDDLLDTRVPVVVVSNVELNDIVVVIIDAGLNS
mgnify:CR=1 FL=1